ncbi:MAG: cytochrome c oxidase assembly protein [Hyphomicrobiales bacterium]|nr:MAG: cytochrome c oxidase assembly protein [Hyphomicrobiales bacterium]
MTTTEADRIKRRRIMIPIIALSVVCGMLGLTYASVPLYRIFCQVTGYGGTTQAAESASDVILDRKVTVEFDANTAKGIGWKFKPSQHSIKLRLGEEKLAFFTARNLTDKAITGTAVFNVTPQSVGSYFNKIECFCFTEQTLQPGETKQMPVSFFIDPELDKDSNLDSIKIITLSYTFFPVEGKARQKTSSKPRKTVDG